MDSLTLYGVTDQLCGQYLKYSDALRTAGEAFAEIDGLFKNDEFLEKKGSWKKEAKDDFSVAYGKTTEKGKIISLKTELPAPISLVFKETWEGIDRLPVWNPNVCFARMIDAPTKNFDICNYGNNDIFVITGRDVVCTRLYREVDDGYILASRSIELPELPERKDKVRAEIILGGAKLWPHPDKEDWTIVEGIMHADPKGLLPKAVVNQVLGKISLMDSKHNREYYAELWKKERMSG